MNKDYRNMIIVFIGYFFSSLFSNTLSPFITTIKNNYNVSSNTIAILPSVVYFASFGMSILSARLMQKIGLKKGLSTGFCLTIFASLIIIISKSFYALLFGYFISGLAIGMMSLFFSTILSILPTKYQKFSLANACFGLGGILILPIDRLILKNGIKFNYTYIIHILCMCLLLMLVRKMDIQSSSGSKHHAKVSFDIIKNPLVMFFSIAIFFYVGAEISTTNWTGGFLEKCYGVNKEEVPNILSGFWILFTIGRSIGDKLLEKVGQLKFLAISPIISIAGVIIILTGTNKIQALVGLAIIGISIALMYPALQGYLVQHVGKENVYSASAIIMIFNYLGATFLTYIIGFAGGINIKYVFIIQIVFYVYIALVSVRYLTFKAENTF
ncbi:MFS transporter [Clostridium scatologenes]|uniref:Major facilitator superfamily MFS_1 n=1 Tax=Clostridium scatologenes TaxID=1548 RepID=A0A0E3M9P2_CLOSL|nr:MFS transporter [Clostridium scatologenes]AKA69732.1 major facilitator superfamily MFS_1 [Clostridium scatologenes]